jgi:hypothetical protein
MVTIGCASQVDSRRLQGEEGIVNLMRASLFAGAKSVVASLWGDPTYDLSPTTYGLTSIGNRQSSIARCDTETPRLKGNGLLCVSEPLWRPMGEEKADALRKAKLDLLVEFGGQASPVFWAGFVMVGAGTGIPFTPRQRPLTK